MSTVLLMMVVALSISSQGGLMSGSSFRHGLAAGYAAEAGLADLVSYLQAHNLDSPPSPFQGKLDSGSSYEIRFGGASLGPLDSINNLTGSAAVASFRGPNSLPPHTALIVVQGKSSGARRVLEVILRRGQVPLSLGHALQAGQQIFLHGNLKIGGIKSLSDATAVPGNVYSNSPASLSTFWDQMGTAHISGYAKAVGGVALGSYNPLGGKTSGTVPAPTPIVNINARIAQKNHAPAPSIPPVGVTDLAAGDFYHEGDLVVAGDLNLHGTNLYVRGNLLLDGSISGQGSVYVAGATDLKGDAVITANSDQKVALFSQGNIRLSGYDLDPYLSSLGGETASLWGLTKTTLTEVQTLVKQNPYEDLVGGSDGPPAGQQLDAALGTLGRLETANIPRPEMRLLPRLVELLEAQPPTQKRLYAQQRLNQLADFFTYGSHFGGDAIITNNFVTSHGSSHQGLVDSVLDQSAYASLWPTVVNLIHSIDTYRPGAAQFRGLLYSAGNLVVENEISVHGGVLALGNIMLRDGSQVVYVEDFFQQGWLNDSSGQVSLQTVLMR